MERQIPRFLWSNTATTKALKVVFSASLIGVLDALQAKYINVGILGNEVGILYQACFVGATFAAAGLCLHNKSWSRLRNLTNYLMAVPIAAIGDNVSIDAQMLRPYILILPKEGYDWRYTVFGHSAFSPVADWVNQKTFASGLIDGYLFAFGVAVAYLMLQLFWSRHDRINAKRADYASVKDLVRMNYDGPNSPSRA